MYTLKPTNRFKKDLKLAQKRGCDISLLIDVVLLLQNEEQLPVQYQDHDLNGNYIGFRECHIKPDWLLIYRKESETLYLHLTRTGTHSDLF